MYRVAGQPGGSDLSLKQNKMKYRPRIQTGPPIPLQSKFICALLLTKNCFRFDVLNFAVFVI